ncbi:MAG TPA: AarF/ABC1/UbiB kinase family protein [bacterium]|nr:AarF/ABC1/UbiB kinase family protein [bacterium]
MAIPDQFVPRFYKKGIRLKGVVGVLFKHGFFWAAEAMELTRFFPAKMREKIVAADEYQLPVSVRMRRVIEELGPTYVKAGQIISTRPDLIPPDIIKELSKLQDEVPPFPFEQVQECLESELKKPIDHIFKSFARVPIASASIGQVHEAVLADGREVVVKVQRPDIEHIVKIDTEIMYDLAVAAEKRFEEARLYNLVDRVEEFTKTINLELDYTVEGQNADRFRRNFADDDSIYIPSVYWDYTTKKILTMEYIHGIKIKDKDKLYANGYDLTYLTEVIGNAFIKMILLDGFFHGDPHFGNIFVKEGQVVALIDFGMVGVVDPIMKRNMAKYFISLVNQDARALVEVLDEIAYIAPATDRDALTREVGRMMHKYMNNVNLGQINLEVLVLELFNIGMKYKISMPGEFTLMDKTLVTLEGLGRHLDPTFDLIGTAEPAARMLFRRELDPRHFGGDVVRTFLDLRDLATALPKRLDRISKSIERGQIKVRLEMDSQIESLKRLSDSIGRSFNRLSLSIIIAALLIAVSALIPQVGSVRFLNWSMKELLLTALVILPVVWIISLFRSGKH